MSNFKLLNPDCVFIHIPKTGGTSIRKGIWNKNYEGPVFGYIPEEWQHLFKFAFVRHPLQRLVSAYSMFTDGAIGDVEWKKPKDARPLTLEEFIAIVLDESILFDERRKSFEEKIRHHTIPQTHPFNCLFMADYIGYFENFEEDFSIIISKMNLISELPKIHYTNSPPWQTLLKDKLLTKCVHYYQEDFSKLGYAPTNTSL